MNERERVNQRRTVPPTGQTTTVVAAPHPSYAGLAAPCASGCGNDAESGSDLCAFCEMLPEPPDRHIEYEGIGVHVAPLQELKPKQGGGLWGRLRLGGCALCGTMPIKGRGLCANHLSQLNRRESGRVNGTLTWPRVYLHVGRLTLADIERKMILATLAFCRGNQSATARSLGISRPTLARKLRAYDVRPTLERASRAASVPADVIEQRIAVAAKPRRPRAA